MIYYYLFESQRAGKREIPAAGSHANAHNRQGWVKMKEEARNYIQVCYVGSKDLILDPSPAASRVHISRHQGSERKTGLNPQHIRMDVGSPHSFVLAPSRTFFKSFKSK